MLKIISVLTVVFALPLSCYAFPCRIIEDTTAVANEDFKPLPKFLVPEGTENIALKKRVTSSDDFPIIGQLSMVTDGIKEIETEVWAKNEAGKYEAKEPLYNWVELGPGTQWVQIDLGKRSRIYGIQIWHYYGDLCPRIYRDVILQVCDENTFTKNVQTLCNNDQNNSSGLGRGTDREWYEDTQGFRIDTRGKNYEGILGRFVRLYSKGNTVDPQNQYIEVEVIGQQDLSKKVPATKPRLKEWETKLPRPIYR